MSSNDFHEDLQWSEGQHSAEWWTPYYRRAFPTMTSIQSVPGPSAAQRAGIDKFVILNGGKRIAVDEKIRRERPATDILLEVNHVPVNGDAPWLGWIEKPNQFTDYLAVGFRAYQTAFFLPFITLQTAWKKNGAVWINRYGIVKSPNPRTNPNYHTHNVCVPTEVLLGKLLDAIRVVI